VHMACKLNVSRYFSQLQCVMLSIPKSLEEKIYSAARIYL